MASTYSPNLRLELIGTGEQQGTWGATTNTNLGTLIEEAIGGYVSVTVTDGADTTLTTANGTADQSRNMTINLAGALTATRNVICPAIEKIYIIKNATSGGFAVTFKVSGQTGVSIPNGSTVIVYVDGTDARLVSQFPVPVTQGGTGGTTSTGSGAVVLATSPALVTPNLGTPSAATLTNATGLPLTTGVTGTLPVANGGTGVTTSTGTGSVVLSASPALSGTPTSTTAAVDTNTTQIATTAYVVGQGYAKLASPALTGTPTAPSAAGYTDTTQIATTAQVYDTVTTVPENAQTGTSYQLVLSDAGKMVTLSNASAITLTIPTNATVAFPVDTRVDILQYGAGQVTVGGAGVTIRSAGSKLKLAGQYSGATLWKKDTNEWVLIGDISA